MTDDSPGAPSSAPAVLEYFLKHPNAADGVEGIARWRIQDEIARHTVDQVRRALEWLVQEGFLELQQATPGVAPMYRLNSRRAADAQRFLATKAAAPAAIAGPRDGWAPSELLASALKWVDATLLRYAREHPPAGDDFPGLAKSHGFIERTLLPPVVPAGTPAPGDATDPWPQLWSDITTADPATERLSALCVYLSLTERELQALLLCLAPEIDTHYQTVFGVLNDDLVGRRAATLGLLCRLLGDPITVRHDLEQSGRLVAWRLLDHGSVLPHADEILRLDPFVVGWLVSDAHTLVTDPRLAPFLRLQPWPGAGWLDRTGTNAVVEEVRSLITADPAGWVVVSGHDADGARATFEAALTSTPWDALRIVLPSPGPTDAAEVSEVSTRIARAARLSDAIAVVDAGDKGLDALGPGGMAHLLRAAASERHPVVLLGSQVEQLVGALPGERGHWVQAHLPREAALAPLYASAAADAGLELSDDDAARLAMSFPLSIDRIAEATRLATVQPSSGDAPQSPAARLAAACRRLASSGLPRFGRRIDPVFRLDDVVLGEEQHSQLTEIVAHVRHASTVMHRWGFSAQLPYGRGVTALFCGPSGTGKTMAAQAIARELGTEAYLVDLSRVVSKYIGESEKNLDAVINDAEASGAVLCFDEADALFGKRSEIKDAHDRYANIEVAYLLQRMETFAGLAILTTNFKQNLDPAFLRRLRFVVDFKRPDERARESIWRRCLPLTAPQADDIAFRYLARRLDLAGGNIQQIAIRAAFGAAREGAREIAMRHVVAAARAELLKVGQPTSERELAEFEAAREAAGARVA